MESLNTKMQQPNTVWWMDILNWFKDNALVVGSLGLGFKALDKGFKFLSEGREAQIRAIVAQEIKANVNPNIKELTEGIKELRESIWDLKNEIKK
jgi:hypothetical protein